MIVNDNNGIWKKEIFPNYLAKKLSLMNYNKHNTYTAWQWMTQQDRKSKHTRQTSKTFVPLDLVRSWWNCPLPMTTCSSFSLLKALFKMRPCWHIICHFQISKKTINSVKTTEIPQWIELLQACKHEQAWFGQFCDIYPWLANPFEGSGVQMQLNKIVTTYKLKEFQYIGGKKRKMRSRKYPVTVIQYTSISCSEVDTQSTSSSAEKKYSIFTVDIIEFLNLFQEKVIYKL